MAMSAGVSLVGLGHYVPAQRIPNEVIEARLGLSAGWIERRTGIVSRAYLEDDFALSDLAIAAGEKALAHVGSPRSSIGLLLLATSTPDHILPPSAPLVAHRLGLTEAGAIDLAGACAGFVYALTLADAYVRRHQRGALIIAGNVLSRRINPEEQASAVLFADAAGACVLMPSDDPRQGLIGAELASDGSGYDLIKIAAGGSRAPFDASTPLSATHMTMAYGQDLFVRAVEMMSQSAERAMADAGIGTEAISRFIPHQANSRILKAVSHRIGIDEHIMLSSIALYGNSSAATIPLTLSLAHQDKMLEKGETLLMTAAGAGLTGGAAVWRV
jgi:3-oxoacyl-[acyl-carrier-protein] synthase-3